MYKVIKDGKELKSYKILATAKKAAEKEGAEVWKDGKCVYPETLLYKEETHAESASTIAAESTSSKDAEPKSSGGVVVQPERYLLKTLMNVRSAPSMTAPIATVLPNKTIVNVVAIENDWMRLEDGLFILFGDGKYAEKV